MKHQVQVCVKGDIRQESRWRTDSYWSWLVCTAAAISLGIVTGIFYSFGLLLPPLMESFESSRQATGRTKLLQLSLLISCSLLYNSYFTLFYLSRPTEIEMSAMKGFD